MDSLRRAQISPCPHCDRETKTTTDGFCADCWRAKSENALSFRTSARTEPILDLEELGLEQALMMILGLGTAVVLLLHFLTPWI